MRRARSRATRSWRRRRPAAPVTTIVSAAGLTFPVNVTGLDARTRRTRSASGRPTRFGSGPAAPRRSRGRRRPRRITTTGVTYGQQDHGHRQGRGRRHRSARSPARRSTCTAAIKGRRRTSTRPWAPRPRRRRTARSRSRSRRRPAARYYVTSRGTDRMGANSATRYVTVRATVTIALSKRIGARPARRSPSRDRPPGTGAARSSAPAQGGRGLGDQEAASRTATGAYALHVDAGLARRTTRGASSSPVRRSRRSQREQGPRRHLTRARRPPGTPGHPPARPGVPGWWAAPTRDPQPLRDQAALAPGIRPELSS